MDATQTHVTLTRKLIFDGMSEAGGWNRAQLDAIGISWKDRHVSGWIERASGRVVTRAEYAMFLALTGRTIRKVKQEPPPKKVKTSSKGLYPHYSLRGPRKCCGTPAGQLSPHAAGCKQGKKMRLKKKPRGPLPTEPAGL